MILVIVGVSVNSLHDSSREDTESNFLSTNLGASFKITPELWSQKQST